MRMVKNNSGLSLTNAKVQSSSNFVGKVTQDQGPVRNSL